MQYLQLFAVPLPHALSSLLTPTGHPSAPSPSSNPRRYIQLPNALAVDAHRPPSQSPPQCHITAPTAAARCPSSLRPPIAVDANCGPQICTAWHRAVVVVAYCSSLAARCPSSLHYLIAVDADCGPQIRAVAPHSTISPRAPLQLPAVPPPCAIPLLRRPSSNPRQYICLHTAAAVTAHCPASQSLVQSHLAAHSVCGSVQLHPPSTIAVGRSLLPPPPFTRTAPAAPLQVFGFVHPSSFTPWFCAMASPKHHCRCHPPVQISVVPAYRGQPPQLHTTVPSNHNSRSTSPRAPSVVLCKRALQVLSQVLSILPVPACTISRHLETTAMLRADPRPLLQHPEPRLDVYDTNIFSNFSLTLPTGDKIPNIVKIPFDQHEGECSSCRSLVWQIWLFNDLTTGDNASQWIVFINAWVQYCIAIQLPLPSAVRLFIDVLWAQRQGRQYDALQLLVGAQVQSIKAVQFPKETNLVQVQINMQEDTDMLGNLDHEDNFPSDPKDDISMVLDDYEDSDEYSDESEHSDDPTATLLAQCIGWDHSLHIFFDTTSFANPQVERQALNNVVRALCEMRKIRDRTFSSDAWCCAFQQSGLCKLIEHIINPHFREEINRRHVFFPSSEENWHFEWSRFILPTLRSMALHWTHPIDDWDVYDLWRHVSEANFRTFQLESPGAGWEQLQFVLLQAQLEREHAKDVKRQWSRPRLDKSHPKVEPRIHQPSNSRSSPSTAKAEILGAQPPPPKTQPDPEFHCYYKVLVSHRTEAEIKAWRSAFLTCAPAHDFRNTGNATVLSPTALKFIEIAHRPDVYRDCQRDPCAGCYATPTTRSDDSQSEGTLTPVGSRQASGGAKGDGYRPYVHHKATREGTEAFFAHGRDADTMMETVVADLCQIIKKAGLNRVVTGTNLGPCAANSGSGHRRLMMSTTLPMLNGGATSKLLRTVYGFSTHVNSMEQCFLENPLAYLVPYPAEPTPPSA
ncbi:hypothetical protein B0H10DRAFT_1971716 [Mycena sp. CBHHK59/15]|nr:hypothetical protein B0H10DRAFT_1971716 [Mycena sp. CBHHK59/15]